MKKYALLLVLLLCGITGFSQETKTLLPLIQNVYGRDHQLLNGYWHYLVDPLETGYYDYRRNPSPTGFFMDQKTDNVNTFKEYDFDSAPVMPIPGDWNTQNAELFNYEGTLWYKHTFNYDPSDKRVFLYFGACNYDTKVWVNTKKAGDHEGGYTPFNFDVTALLKKGSNTLIVKVDDKRRVDAIPTNNFDWFNFGGITRDVLLVELPQTFVQSYSIQLKKGSPTIISGSVKLNVAQADQKVTLEIPELKIKKEVTTDAKGEVSFDIKSNPVLWSPENPKLYAVTLTTPTDKVSDQIGFRTIETRGREILLNGKPIFLKGISVHEEAAFRNGRLFSAEEDRTLLSWAKELGCNYVRLAHYPHNEQMVREAEKMGIMVWSEIPVYWTIQWEDPKVYANALNQLSEMMERDKNRANVIIWSISNETPPSDPRDTFLSNLAIYAHKKDSTRLISMAMERSDKSATTLSVKDNLSKYVDVISFNEYVGWYDGTTEKIDRVKWEIDYDKPLIISEFGGEAVFGNHGSATDLWTEENQADMYTKTLKMIDERMPKISGMSPWILKDFRSSRRLLPNVQDGFNRKGLISDKGQKKKAFYVLQKWYMSK